MKRFSGIEKAALLLAMLLIVCGFCMAIRPKEMVVLHPGGRRYQTPLTDRPEYMSRDTVRVVGCVSAAFGVGIISFVFYRSGK